MLTKIAILLPYKENFSKNDSGSVSLFVKDFNHKSIYLKCIKIYGNTSSKPLPGFSYKNMKNTLMYRFGRNKFHTKSFINEIKINPLLELVEIHNRPISALMIKKELPRIKVVFYYHNDPLSMKGFADPDSRKKLLDSCEAIYFVSNYIKQQFLDNLKINKVDQKKLFILYNGIQPLKKIKKKRIKNIIFIGRLEKNKGFFEFLEGAYKILDEFSDWQVDIFGSSNKGIIPISKNSKLKYHGHTSNDKVLEYLSKSSISVIPALWNEPFGRTLIESINAGCAVISSQKGGLLEISKYFVLIKLINPSKISIYNAIKKLIMSSDELQKLQGNSIKNTPFNLKNLISYHDNQRSKLISQK